MRGWVIKFEDGRVTDCAVDNNGPRNLSKVSILDNREILEGVDSLIPKVLVENTSPTGLDIIFTSDDGQYADPSDFGGASNVGNSPIEGNVDVMTPWGASGWARFVDGRDEFVRVEVVLNGVVIGDALACDFRPGLRDDDSKRKFCGFTFRFKTLLPADVDLTIRAVGSNGSAILSYRKPGGIEGYVDSVSKLAATGWAWMPLDAGRQLRIEARLGDRVVASAITHQLRDDIRKSGRGSGYCGFTLQFDPRLSDGDTPDFFAIGSAEEAPLASAEIDASELAVATTAMEAAPGVENETASTPSLDIEGSVDLITRWLASGWVWRPSTPDQSLEVEAFLNGKAIGHATANQWRPDLAEYGKGTGRHGFVISFSSPLEDETLPSFRVKEEEGSVVIPNHAKVNMGVKTATANEDKSTSSSAFLLPAVEGHIDHMTRRDAKGWAWFPSAPELTAQIDAVLDGKVIGRALANQLRPELAQHGKGTGLYGFQKTLGASQGAAGLDEIIESESLPHRNFPGRRAVNLRLQLLIGNCREFDALDIRAGFRREPDVLPNIVRKAAELVSEWIRAIAKLRVVSDARTANRVHGKCSNSSKLTLEHAAALVQSAIKARTWMRQDAQKQILGNSIPGPS